MTSILRPPKAIPAMTPLGGLLTTLSPTACPGETTLGFEIATGRPPAANWRVSVPAVSSSMSLKLATPFTTVTVVVPINVPPPVLRDAVTIVLLSLVTILPY